MKYDKIIFICTGNTFLSPTAEAIYRTKARDGMPKPYSRGLVVLFQEPISPKVNLLLSRYDMQTSNHELSRKLEQDDITEQTLVLTMTLSEKVQIMEEYEQPGQVFTLGEYTGVETDVPDPYGAEEEAYIACFMDLSKRIDLVQQRLNRENA